MIIDDITNTINLNKNLPIFAGIHLVNTCCDSNDRQGIASPDCLHKDGETFTFAHLFSRNNFVEGGINYISTPKNIQKKPEELDKSEIKCKFILNGFLDSFAVYDEKVSHYVSPVKTIKEGMKAERKIILIDFCNASRELN